MMAMASRSVSAVSPMKSRLLAVAFVAAALSLTPSHAYATPISVSFDDVVKFGAATDIFAGTVTFDPAAETFATNIAVTGDLFPGTYTYSASSITFILPSFQFLGALAGNPNVELDGSFAPSPFSSSSVFTGFQLAESIPPNIVSTFESTSVTTVAVPEPSSLALFGAALVALISFGLVVRQRDKVLRMKHARTGHLARPPSSRGADGGTAL